MPAAKPNVFNIPASAQFLPVLIGALGDGKLVPGFPASADPLELSRATIYLPTRRACRLARDFFLESLNGDAAILPRIVPLGEMDEDEIAFAEAATGAEALALPNAISGLERQLTLSQIIAKWATVIRSAQGSPLVANTPGAAFALAGDLARLMDDITTRQVKWSDLDKLVPDDLDAYWQQSLDFLKFVHPRWDDFLREKDTIESAERRDKLIEAEAKRLQGSDGPVIAAGSTGSMPATAKLLATIARLPHGAVVLPGLDMDLDDASWRSIAGNSDDKSHDGAPSYGHAQFSMQALLTTIGIARDEVEMLSKPTPHGREKLASEALRPAATTDLWQAQRDNAGFGPATNKALSTVSMIEAANPEEEALAIAVTLRKALNTPGKTAALVTPDRALARRVVAALERWHVAIDDSGGDPLPETQAGRFARLAAEAALDDIKPVTLLALLKHPLLRLGAGDNAIATLEKALLRGPRPKPGTEGLKTALQTFRATRDTLHGSDPRRRIKDDELAAAEDLVEKLKAALEPLERLAKGDQKLAEMAECHCKTMIALSCDSEKIVHAFDGNDGKALAEIFKAITDKTSAAWGVGLERHDYAELFHAITASSPVRRPEVRDVRVRIYGPLEARLQTADLLVLGGLNEATWPPETRSDPWLSRPMRRQLGLDPPERRIGLSAHDFAQMLGAPEIVLTRAAKLAGAPTVTSRFVQRIAALAGKKRWDEVLARGNEALQLARALDATGTVNPAKRPEPRPPVAARPSRLSVTAIEDWLRDPYTVYAKYILRLYPLDAVDTQPGARDRGTVIHGAIGDFTVAFADGLPPDPQRQLLLLGEKRFAPLEAYAEAKAFWWPRFERIAQWFAQWDRARRDGIATLHGEIKGELKFPIGEREFTLSAVADRIEWRRDGSYAIIDYKTGAARTKKQVSTGLAPQLTLEGAILREGGFKGLRTGSISEITYVTLKGGDPAGKPEEITFKDRTADEHADYALKRLKELAATFENADTPYMSLVHPMWTNHYGDYDHLARVKEWSLSGGGDEGGE